MVSTGPTDLRESSKASLEGLSESLNPFGFLGLRLYGPHCIHGFSDPLETGSDGLTENPGPKLQCARGQEYR